MVAAGIEFKINLKSFLPIASSKPKATSSSKARAIIGYAGEVRSSKGVIERVKVMTRFDLVACESM